MGDIGRWHERWLLDEIASTALERETLALKADEMRRQWGYETAPSTERVVIDHLVRCWFHLEYQERRLLAALGGHLHYERHVGFEKDRAARGFLRASRTLERVRLLRLRPRRRALVSVAPTAPPAVSVSSGDAAS